MGLTLKNLKAAVAGSPAAFRCVTEYQPAGGAGDKVFPPTYEGGKYAVETRTIAGERVECVLLDSVQAQANRAELALLEAHRAGRVTLPLIITRFDDPRLLKRFTVTSLEASHRAADAVFRDSVFEGKPFRATKGKVLNTADIRNATGLFALNPMALVSGLWDSTGPRGGAGAKFQRALVSEIVGHGAISGVRTSSRLDHAEVLKGAGPVFRRPDGGWTLDPDAAIDRKGKKVLVAKNGNKEVLYDPAKDEGKVPDQGRPSNLNHGNVTPDFAYLRDSNKAIVRDKNGDPVHVGGFTITKAVQTTVLSLVTLRRLRFPLGGSPDSDSRIDQKARVVLAALALAASVLAREEGADLRSRCLLVPTQAFTWEILGVPGTPPTTFALTGDEAISLLTAAIDEAKAARLPWEGEIILTPSAELLELVRRSQELASSEGAGAD